MSRDLSSLFRKYIKNGIKQVTIKFAVPSRKMNFFKIDKSLYNGVSKNILVNTTENPKFKTIFSGEK